METNRAQKTPAAATIESLIAQVGFEDHGWCAASDLAVDSRVRDMCAADRCNFYNHSWACPPACGPIEDFQREFSDYDHCVVVQTVRELEDDYDIEMMMAADAIQKERIAKLSKLVADAGIQALTLSSGTCTICAPCAYPDDPCRFPDRRFVSMEAAGLNVTETCKAADVAYNHGPRTITYSGCILY